MRATAQHAPARLEARQRARRLERAPAIVVEPLRGEGMSDAFELQRGLLPSVPIARGALRISGDVLGSRRTSGDCFDVVDGPGGRTSVFVVDVAGHGVSAALIGSAAREALRVALLAGGDLETAAAALESCLEAHRDMRRATASFALLRFSSDASLVEVVNAGLPPVTVLLDGRTIAMLASRSMPAGFAPDAQHPSEVLRIPEGAVVLVASDGATRGALDAAGVNELGARLLREVPDLPGARSEELRDAVRLHLGVHGAPEDDATVVVAGRR